MNYDVGSYWVYLDQITNIEDSVYVVSFSDAMWTVCLHEHENYAIKTSSSSGVNRDYSVFYWKLQNGLDISSSPPALYEGYDNSSGYDTMEIKDSTYIEVMNRTVDGISYFINSDYGIVRKIKYDGTDTPTTDAWFDQRLSDLNWNKFL